MDSVKALYAIQFPERGLTVLQAQPDMKNTKTQKLQKEDFRTCGDA